ncbi:MAG: chemotaxis protein CheX [Deltaproteobacteria bacterium]|nr:chemotaxis protein CheX [Deltaproteobacteria bacterium]
MEGLSINRTLMDCAIKGTVEGVSMTGLEPDAVGVSRFITAPRELSVIVGLHGKCNGNMTLNLSKRTSTFLASKLLDENIGELDEDTIDAICEIGNMIAGRFKDLLLGTDYEFEAISLPALVFGANYNLYHLKNIVTVSVVFELEEVSILHVDDKFFTTSISLLAESGGRV